MKDSITVNEMLEEILAFAFGQEKSITESVDIIVVRKMIREELTIFFEKKKGNVKTRKYKGKTYKAPESMVKADSFEDKVKQASSWADDPEAAAAAATIVKTGKPPGKKKKSK